MRIGGLLWMPGHAALAFVLLAFYLCTPSVARAANGQDQPDLQDILALAEIATAEGPGSLDACGDRAVQCVENGGIPYAEAELERSCKMARKYRGLAVREKMKSLLRLASKGKLLVEAASANGPPQLFEVLLVPDGGPILPRHATSQLPMTEAELEEAVLEARVTHANRLRSAALRWVSQGRPAPLSVPNLLERDFSNWNFDAVSPTCGCRCARYVTTGPQVTNADKGDVVLVPLTAPGGDSVVGAVTSALGQNHRHTLIFKDNGHNVVHSTQFNGGSDHGGLDIGDYLDGSCGGLYPGAIMNGLPGIIENTVEEALDTGRLAPQGLVLRAPISSFRPFFEAAADEAVDAAVAGGYYKVSDYSLIGSSTWGGMKRPWGTPSTAPIGSAPFEASSWTHTSLRGTMCSGLIYHAFQGPRVQALTGLSPAFPGFTLQSYSGSLREDVADVLYDAIRTQAIKSVLSDDWGLQKVLVGSTLNCFKKIASQVVNCFAGTSKDCSSTKKKDFKHLTSASSISPDNLLPTSFTLQGSGGCEAWVNYAIPSPSPPLIMPICTGDTVDSAIGHDSGQAATPFQKVEPLNLVLTSWAYADVRMIGDWLDELLSP